MPSRPQLTPTTLEVLLALAETPRHGYSLMQEVDAATGGRHRLGAGTLYTLLKRLLDARWIEEVDPPADSDPRRRYYRTTQSGAAAAHGELDRLDALLRSPRTLRFLKDRP